MYKTFHRLDKKTWRAIFVMVTLITLLIPLAFVHASSNALAMLGSVVGNIILKIASMVTYVGGMLLETSITELVLKLGILLGPAGELGKMIGLLWGFVRDICNLVFIFGFIYIGIRTIIDANDSNTKRMLASLIIGAILINFSLYFTKVVIDISNYTAVEIYHATFEGEGTLSAKLGKTVGVFEFMKGPDGITLTNQVKDGSFSYFFMAALFLIIAGFVFAAGAILLITRFIALVFIMIFSPILFAATVFPQTEKYASQLWHYLFNYSFFAPAYLILLLISIKLIEAVTKALGVTQGSSVPKTLAEGMVGTFNVILAFLIGIMIMIFALKVAKQFGIVGADRVMAVGNNMRGRLQGFAGRNLVGRPSNYLLKRYEKEDANASKMKGVRGGINRLGRGILQYSGADEGIRNTLKSGKTAKFGGDRSLEDKKKWNKERDEKRSELNEFDSFKQAVKEGSGARPTEEQKIAMEQAIAGASVKYLEKLSQGEREKITKYMTQGQFDNLDKSTELSDTDKRSLGEARQKALKGVYNMERDSLMKASVENLNALGLDFLKREDNAVRLNSSQMDDLKKKLTPTEFGILTKARNDALVKIASGQPIETNDVNGVLIPGQTKTRAHILSQKPGEISKLPAEALKHLAAELPLSAMEKISQDATLNKMDQAAIRQQAQAVIAQNQNISELSRIKQDPTLPKNVKNQKIKDILGEIAADPKSQHLKDMNDWLDESPAGKRFGK